MSNEIQAGGSSSVPHSSLLIAHCSFTIVNSSYLRLVPPSRTGSEKVMLSRSPLLVCLVVLGAGGCTPAPPPPTTPSVVGRDAQWKQHLEQGKQADARGDHDEAEKDF